MFLWLWFTIIASGHIAQRLKPLWFANIPSVSLRVFDQKTTPCLLAVVTPWHTEEPEEREVAGQVHAVGGEAGKDGGNYVSGVGFN